MSIVVVLTLEENAILERDISVNIVPNLTVDGITDKLLMANRSGMQRMMYINLP